MAISISRKARKQFDGSIYLDRLAIFRCRFIFILPHSIDCSFEKHIALPERQFQHVGTIVSPASAPARCAGALTELSGAPSTFWQLHQKTKGHGKDSHGPWTLTRIENGV